MKWYQNPEWLALIVTIVFALVTDDNGPAFKIHDYHIILFGTCAYLITFGAFVRTFIIEILKQLDLLNNEIKKLRTLIEDTEE